MKPRGIRTDGIRTLADFQTRFRVCEESGCWEWRGKSYKGRCAQVWLSGLERQCSIGQAIHFLTLGQKMPAGKVMRCTCTTLNCGNPGHRKLVARGRQVVKGVRKDAGTRIRIAQARREASKVGMTAERAAAIRASDEPLKVLAARYGISPSFASLIRLGKAWGPLAVGASVFAMVGRT